jgi:predicted dehydrogenase
MTEDRIRVGAVGANISGWANAHLQAITALPQFELVATCTTRMESARESAQAFGAPLAFDDYREMAARDDIDAVLVCLQAPRHMGPTTSALEAGKHVYTEWPFGKDLEESEQMAELAQAKDVRTMVGIQARSSPTYIRLKELVDKGYVGDVLAAKVSWMASEQTSPAFNTTSESAWRGQREGGANTLTIGFGHVIDPFCAALGEFTELAAIASTQVKQWNLTDTGGTIDVTAPDNILVSGRVTSGAVVSAQVAWLPGYNYSSDYRAEIYGTKGSLLLKSPQTNLIGGMKIFGSRDGSELEQLEIPGRLDRVGSLVEDNQGVVFYLAQAWARFGEAITTGQRMEPDFDSGVTRRRLIDAIYRSSDTGQAQKL